MQCAEDAARALFSGEVDALDLETLEEVFANAPGSDHAAADLEGEGVLVADVLAQTTLAKSKGEARKHLDAGAITVNGRRVEGSSARLGEADLLHGTVALVRRGKKAWHVTRWR